MDGVPVCTEACGVSRALEDLSGTLFHWREHSTLKGWPWFRGAVEVLVALGQDMSWL